MWWFVRWLLEVEMLTLPKYFYCSPWHPRFSLLTRQSLSFAVLKEEKAPPYAYPTYPGVSGSIWPDPCFFFR